MREPKVTISERRGPDSNGMVRVVLSARVPTPAGYRNAKFAGCYCVDEEGRPGPDTTVSRWLEYYQDAQGKAVPVPSRVVEAAHRALCLFAERHYGESIMLRKIEADRVLAEQEAARQERADFEALRARRAPLAETVPVASAPPDLLLPLSRSFAEEILRLLPPGEVRSRLEQALTIRR